MNGLMLDISVMLGLIGRLYYTRPARSFYERLIAEHVFAEMPAQLDNEDFKAGCAFLSRCGEDYEVVDEDYNRLFLGVGVPKAPPWQSMHGPEPLMWQPSVLAVREWYKKYGLQIERKYKEPDDHIGLMLIFAGYLAETAEKKDLDAYCAEQLQTWVPGWCDLVIENARTDFFKGLALVTKGILKSL